MITYILGGITNVPNNGDFFVKIPKYESQGDSGLKFVFSAIIMNSNVRVEVQTEKEVEDLGTLRNRVTNALRMFLDSYGYINGMSFDVTIHYIISQNKREFFDLGIKELRDESEKRPVQDFMEIVKLFHGTRYNQLRLALRDLSRAIKYPQETGMFCYRAVESLRLHFKEDSEDVTKKKVSKLLWERFRSNLNLSKEFLDPLIEESENSRHGNLSFLSSEKRVEFMRIAWNVVDRFIIFVKNNEIKLDEKLYPVLEKLD